jgi:hypothetical protein
MELMQWRDRPSLRRVAVGAAVALALLTAAIWTTIDKRNLPTTQLETPRGTIVVEVADTPAARSAGLSNRRGLSGVDGTSAEVGHTRQTSDLDGSDAIPARCCMAGPCRTRSRRSC